MFRILLLRLLAIANARLAKRTSHTPPAERTGLPVTKAEEKQNTPNTIYPLW